jgi:hypothetical protein
MDLPLIFRVVWRFRLLFVTGMIAAIALSLLSFVRVDTSDGFRVSYRDQEQWESLSTLFITSTGFPWGAVSDQPQVAPRTDDRRGASGVDAGRLTTLAGLYMQLATSDPVLQLMLQDGPIDGLLQTFPVFSTNNSDGSQLPMVTFSAVTASPESAMRLAQRHVQAFTTFIEREQRRSSIPPEERVRVQVVRQPQGAALLVPRKKTRPIIVFVAVMSAVFGLMIALENMRPRLRPVPEEDAASGRRAA